jgi:predicted dehydrogenase
MKFLIAGLGSIGCRHLRNLISLGERDIILYRSKLSNLVNNEFKEFLVETNINLALEHKPDAVIISNPTSLHLDVAIPAAEAGCHILLEKPISNSLERINDLKLALQRGGSKILVGFQYRFHPTLKIAARILSNGDIGNPVSARAHWGEYLPDWHTLEDFHNSYSARVDLGGGVVLTLCHPIDYLSWLLGRPKFI